MTKKFTPRLVDVGTHHLCPGCGEPIAIRSVVEAVDELGLREGDAAAHASRPTARDWVWAGRPCSRVC